MKQLDTTPLINIKNLSLTINKINILANINLQLQACDFLTIIGPNGAGKSSLLKCILGIYPVTKGYINKHHHLTIGYTPQRFKLNIAMPINVMTFITLNKKYQPAHLKHLIQLTNLKHLLDHQLDYLSGGELQRVLLVRALINQPQLLILDEPLQNLDLKTKLEFLTLITNINQQYQTSIMFISHDLELELLQQHKKYILLNKTILAQGNLFDITQNKQFKTLFGKQVSDLIQQLRNNT